PTGLASTGATTTTIPLSWTASTDNVGVTGYTVFLDGVNAGTPTTTSFTFAGLACGTSHTLGVRAFDAAGHPSARPNPTPSPPAPAGPSPTRPASAAPTGLASPGATPTTIPLSWTASTDNVGVTGYTVFLDGVNAGTPTPTSFTFAGLACGTSHTLGVRAFDA